MTTAPRTILYRGSRDELNEMCRVKDDRIAELEAKRMAIIRQIDAVIWNFERSTVTLNEHERAWRNVLAEAMK